jgi:hypothetical protein
MNRQKNRWPTLLAAVFLSAALASCGGKKKDDYYPEDGWSPTDREMRPVEGDADDRILSGGGLSLFSAERTSKKGSGLGVNTYLWRATLDTLAFMPLKSIDAQGGVIITDWHANPNAPAERFKMNVYILDQRLRADGVKVSVFRQQQTEAGWVDALVDPETATQLENQILRRARELKIESE